MVIKYQPVNSVFTAVKNSLSIQASEVLMGIDFANFFQPRSVALLGASRDPKKWGSRILGNLLAGGYEGRIYPVNPNGGEIHGLKAYQDITHVPETPDLAVIVVPLDGVLDAIRGCVNKGINAGVIITAGFAETGEKGAELQRKMVAIARQGGMSLIGPNCFGLVNPWHKLYSQISNVFPPPGPIAVVSQSGNLGFSIARRTIITNFGCSRVISTGNEADLHVEDMLTYLADDPRTKVILGYIEGFKDGRRFFDIARQVTLRKPVVIIKVGETEAGAAAAMSHTAALSGSDSVIDAMFRQTGIIRVHNLDELMNVAYGFLCHPLPRGRRVGIVTSGGGSGVLAADACAKLGLEVVRLPQKIIAELDKILPEWWSRNNPVDMVGDIQVDAMQRVVDLLLGCEEIDGIVKLGVTNPWQLWTLKIMSEEERNKQARHVADLYIKDFEKIREISQKHGKPVITAMEVPILGGDDTLDRMVHQELWSHNLMCYDTPDKAVKVFDAMVRYNEYLKQRGQKQS